LNVVTVKSTDGKWIKLPDLGHNAEGVTNAIRAWIKRTAQDNAG